MEMQDPDPHKRKREADDSGGQSVQSSQQAATQPQGTGTSLNLVGLPARMTDE
jgi:hypothetical protein